MLLQQIVEILDAELAQLEALRSLVARLDGTLDLPAEAPVELPSAAASRITPPAPEKPEIAESMQVTRVRNARRPYTKRAKKQVPEAKALASSIPAGPVVVPRSALAKQTAAKEEARAAKRAEPAQEIGSLGSMIRALRLDASA